MWIVTLTIITALLLSNCYCFHIKMKAVSQLTWYITIAVLSIGDKADFYVYFPLHLCAIAKDFNFQTVSNIPQRIFLLVVHAPHAFCFAFYCHSKKQPQNKKKEEEKEEERKREFLCMMKCHFARLKLSTVAPVSVVDIEQWRTLHLNLNRKLLLWCDEQQQ